jgi:hypothetical protein
MRTRSGLLRHRTYPREVAAFAAMPGANKERDAPVSPLQDIFALTTVR